MFFLEVNNLYDSQQGGVSVILNECDMHTSSFFVHTSILLPKLGENLTSAVHNAQEFYESLILLVFGTGGQSHNANGLCIDSA